VTLFFRGADFMARLCVPRAKRSELLVAAHEDATITAHAGPQKLYQALADRFYWPTLKKDILRFCKTCDVCQKIKPLNFSRYGWLHPNPIPLRPYESISMDLIGPLPPSEGYTAVLVVVDRLSKHAQFIPTDMELKTDGFAHLFVKHVACRFGLPDSIYADKDGRWFSGFWRQVSLQMKISMKISSARHPQHDGQTEIVNHRLEWMLRAYVAEDRSSWARWLHLLELAYNSASHASTGNIPFWLLMGFVPKNYLDYLSSSDARKGLARSTPAEIHAFLGDIQMHRDAARTAIAKAQVKQAEAYNAGRRLISFKENDLVLVNPHSLRWIESKDMKGVKLVQRWIGPFKVHERVNQDTYRLRMSSKYADVPVFNIEHLRPYWKSPDEYGKRATLPDTRLHMFEADEAEVKAIVGHKFVGRKGSIRFRVHFKGFPPDEDDWVSPAGLKNAPAVLPRYRAEHNV
jgi:hypothetical protein